MQNVYRPYATSTEDINNNISLCQRMINHWTERLKKWDSTEDIFTRVQHYKVDYDDLETFIEDKYGVRPELVALQEWNNNQSHQYSVDGKYLHEWDEKKIDQIRQGDYPMYSVHLILEALARDGYIERGKYLINVSW